MSTDEISIGIMGVLVQIAAYAVVMPLYLIIYLSTSPLMSSKRLVSFLVESSALAAIPVSLAVGFVLPATLMSLPAPSTISYEQKQTFVVIWQMFPVWVAILQAVLPYLAGWLTQARATGPNSSQASELIALRKLYTLLILVAGIGQISTTTLILTSNLFPMLFATEFQGVFNTSRVFVPVAASASVKMSSIGSGAHLLFQYDELIGSTSIALFSVVMYTCARQKMKSDQSIAFLASRGLAAALLTGPSGFAVACIWARDELIAQEQDENKKEL